MTNNKYDLATVSFHILLIVSMLMCINIDGDMFQIMICFKLQISAHYLFSCYITNIVLLYGLKKKRNLMFPSFNFFNSCVTFCFK